MRNLARVVGAAALGSPALARSSTKVEYDISYLPNGWVDTVAEDEHITYDNLAFDVRGLNHLSLGRVRAPPLGTRFLRGHV